VARIALNLTNIPLINIGQIFEMVTKKQKTQKEVNRCSIGSIFETIKELRC
jgi:hypothetical protein